MEEGGRARGRTGGERIEIDGERRRAQHIIQRTERNPALRGGGTRGAKGWGGGQDRRGGNRRKGEEKGKGEDSRGEETDWQRCGGESATPDPSEEKGKREGSGESKFHEPSSLHSSI